MQEEEVMNGDEYYFPEGVYWNGVRDKPEPLDRRDIYLQEAGPGKNEAARIPLTFSLIFVTGSGHLSILGMLPEDVIKVGKWMIEVAEEVKEKR